MAERKDTLEKSSDKTKQDQPALSDPRLRPEEAMGASPLMVAGRVAAWVGGFAFLVGLFWSGITKTMGVGPWIAVGLGAACLAFWLATHIATVSRQIRARGTQAVANSVLFTVFVIGIIFTANYIVGRHRIFHADWTETKVQSLSQGTKEIVKGLKQDITITAFTSPDYPTYEQIRTMLGEYEVLSSRIKVRLWDPKLTPDKMEEYGRPYDGTVFVEAGERREEVQGATEEQLSSAILAATTGKKTKLYFLTGHGEQSLEAYGETGLTVLKQYLTNEQYDVASLSLASQASPIVPDDCAVLAIIGAKQPLMDKELQAVEAYIKQGGNLFLALATPPAPNFKALLGKYGVKPLAGVVMDPGSALQANAQVPLVPRPTGHDIVNDLTMIALPTAIAFEIASATPPMAGPGSPPPPASPAKPLLETTGAAWLETSTKGSVSKDPDEPTGPLTMAVAIDLSSDDQSASMPGAPQSPDNTRKGRIVAIGDYDFLRDDVYQLGLRSNIFLATSSFAWLAKNDRLITVPPQEPLDRKMILGTTQRSAAILISTVIVPLLVLATWGFIWWRRR